MYKREAVIYLERYSSLASVYVWCGIISYIKDAMYLKETSQID